MHTDATLPDDRRTLEDAVRTLDAEPLADQDLRHDTDDDAPAERPREGLPKNYRSRHDRHYVEQLTSATGMPHSTQTRTRGFGGSFRPNSRFRNDTLTLPAGFPSV